MTSRHATTSELKLRSDHWRWEVWSRWVVFTTVGHVLSGILIAVVPGRVPGGFAVALMAVVVALTIVGLLQWLVLRYWAHGLRWWSWVLATVFGQLAGTAVVSIAVMGSLATGALGGVGAHIGGHALQLATKAMSGTLTGGVEGFAQWLVLRRYVRSAGWWVLGTMLAEALAADASLVVGQWGAFERLVLLVITRLTSGSIVGAITGAVLVWLLRQRPKVPAAAEPR